MTDLFNLLGKKLSFLIISFFICTFLYSQEYSIPYHSSDVMTYFSDEMKDNMKNLFQQGRSFAFYFDGFGNFLNFPITDDNERTYDDDKGLLKANLMMGVYVSFHKNFAFVVNTAQAVSTEPEIGTYINGGLIWNSKFGNFGLFAGPYMGRSDGVFEYTGLRIAFVPVINTEEFPLIGLFVKRIEGALNMNDATIHSVNVRLFILPVGTFSFGGFYRQEPFLFASTRIFGGFLEKDIKDGKLLLELGWQQVYDITEYKVNYAEQTPYVKIARFFGGDLFGGSLSAFLSAQYFPIPKIGFNLSLPDDTLLFAEIYWGPFDNFGSKGFEITFGFKIKFGF